MKIKTKWSIYSIIEFLILSGIVYLLIAFFKSNWNIVEGWQTSYIISFFVGWVIIYILIDNLFNKTPKI